MYAAKSENFPNILVTSIVVHETLLPQNDVTHMIRI